MLGALVLAACAGAPAEAWLKLGLDSTEAGQIAFWVWGSGTFTSVDVVDTIRDNADASNATVVGYATTSTPDWRRNLWGDEIIVTKSNIEVQELAFFHLTGRPGRNAR